MVCAAVLVIILLLISLIAARQLYAKGKINQFEEQLMKDVSSWVTLASNPDLCDPVYLSEMNELGMTFMSYPEKYKISWVPLSYRDFDESKKLYQDFLMEVSRFGESLVELADVSSKGDKKQAEVSAQKVTQAEITLKEKIKVLTEDSNV